MSARNSLITEAHDPVRDVDGPVSEARPDIGDADEPASEKYTSVPRVLDPRGLYDKRLSIAARDRRHLGPSALRLFGPVALFSPAVAV